MGFKESFAPFGDASINALNQYGWVLYTFVGLALVVFGFWMWKLWADKKRQWTHKLRVKQVLPNGFLSKEAVINMRRFPLIKTGEVFELENAFMGSYLISELDSYTGQNEYSVIIDSNGRVYTNKGEKFCADAQSVNVSAKHSEIDLALGDFKRNYQEVHKTPKRVEWGQIARAFMWGLAIIALMVLGIKGLDKWGENHSADAQKAIAEAEAYRNLNDALSTMEGVVNGQIILAEELKDLKNNRNIQTIVRGSTNGNP